MTAKKAQKTMTLSELKSELLQLTKAEVNSLVNPLLDEIQKLQAENERLNQRLVKVATGLQELSDSCQVIARSYVKREEVQPAINELSSRIKAVRSGGS